MNVKEELEEVLYKVNNPERYIGNEWNQINKEWEPGQVKMALAFPDVYEIGMSHLGLRLIYQLLNSKDDIVCERCFAPWNDLEEIMRDKQYPLFTLESGREINDFDILGFTLQYEMSYPTIINMINLADIPIYQKDRDDSSPLIMGGGSTVFNPEPLAPFFDLFYMGEAEVGLVELLNKYRDLRRKDFSRDSILRELSKYPGVYVPSLYESKYNEGKFFELKPEPGVKKKIKRQVVSDLDQSFYPTDMIVPYMDIVHNRVLLEIARGCTRGCRFCAAGMCYRPVRERSKETLIDIADRLLDSTGYEEISLTSLSTVDHSQIGDIVKILARRYQDENISISLSSLRVDEFSVELAQEVQRVRKTGLTFAPEAGTQRLRDVINKGVDEENLYNAVRSAFKAGWNRVKLYFMIGLPTETKEDLAGIVKMSKKVLNIGKEVRKNTSKRMRPIEVQVSVSTFVPKPFTPFQWVRMNNQAEIEQKQQYLRNNIKGRGLNFSWNDPELSLIEGVIARGDRRLAPVLVRAWEKGSRFPGWSQEFDPQRWFDALGENKLDFKQYLKERDIEKPLPWEHINMGVSNKFLKDEYKKAYNEEKTCDCREVGCPGCEICNQFDVDLELIGKGAGNLED